MSQEEGKGQTSITDYYATTYRKATTLLDGKSASASTTPTKPPPDNSAKHQAQGTTRDDPRTHARSLLTRRLEDARRVEVARGEDIKRLCTPVQASTLKSEGMLLCRTSQTRPKSLNTPPALLAPVSTRPDPRIACAAVEEAARAFAQASLFHKHRSTKDADTCKHSPVRIALAVPAVPVEETAVPEPVTPAKADGKKKACRRDSPSGAAATADANPAPSKRRNKGSAPPVTNVPTSPLHSAPFAPSEGRTRSMRDSPNRRRQRVRGAEGSAEPEADAGPSRTGFGRVPRQIASNQRAGGNFNKRIAEPQQRNDLSWQYKFSLFNSTFGTLPNNFPPGHVEGEAPLAAGHIAPSDSSCAPQPVPEPEHPKTPPDNVSEAPPSVQTCLPRLGTPCAFWANNEREVEQLLHCKEKLDQDLLLAGDQESFMCEQTFLQPRTPLSPVREMAVAQPRATGLSALRHSSYLFLHEAGCSTPTANDHADDVMGLDNENLMFNMQTQQYLNWSSTMSVQHLVKHNELAGQYQLGDLDL